MAAASGPELGVCSHGVEGQSSETGSWSLREEQWPCFLTVFTVCFKMTTTQHKTLLTCNLKIVNFRQ